MNDMRLGLLGLGVLFVLAVWVFNKIQERRIRKRVEGPFARSRSDVLFDEDGRTESGVASGVASGSYGSGRAEPSFDPAREPFWLADGAQEPSVMAGMAIEPDSEIHALIPLALEQEVSGERVQSCLHGLRHAGRQTVTVLGREDGVWHRIAAGGRYEALLVLVQLASRNGPLNEVEYSEFIAALSFAAEQLPASCEAPEMMETIARARALDGRCAMLDRQIGINLANPEGHWAGPAIDSCARAAGLLLRADGRYHLVTENGRSLFSLQSGDGTPLRADALANWSAERLTLVLDVPRAPEALRPFEQMTATAKALAQCLGAILVDDQLRTLTPASLSSIGRQIEPVYAELEAAGMTAGSERALSLFS